MNTLQINTLVNKCTLLKWVFRGIYPRDKLPKRLTKRSKSSTYIVNLDKQGQEGSHWIAIYVPQNKDYIKYFDSRGLPPSAIDIKQFLCRRKYFQFNNQRLQSSYITTCGQYCLFYLCSRVHGIKPYDIISIFNPNDFIFNDYFVNRVIEGIFNSKLKVYDIEFITSLFKRQWLEQY